MQQSNQTASPVPRALDHASTVGERGADSVSTASVRAADSARAMDERAADSARAPQAVSAAGFASAPQAATCAPAASAHPAPAGNGPLRVAIIDVGSNTAHMCVYDLPSPANARSAKRAFKVKKQLGLASYLGPDGAMDQAGIDACVKAVHDLVNIARSSSCHQIHVFATAAIRQSANRSSIVGAMEEACRIPVRVLSGKEEALLGFAAIRFELHAQNGVLADIGGGSIELVGFERSAARMAMSMPTGSLRLYRSCVSDILPSAEECEAIRGRMHDHLAMIGASELGSSPVLYAIGGSARATLKLIKRCCPGQTDCRNSFPNSCLDELIDRFANDRAAAVSAITRICPDRIHTIMPGMLALQTLVRAIGAQTVTVGSFGAREGYLLSQMPTGGEGPTAAALDAAALGAAPANTVQAGESPAAGASPTAAAPAGTASSSPTPAAVAPASAQEQKEAGRED